MLFCDFQAKLKKLNPKIWFDLNNQVSTTHPDFKIGGLYVGQKHILGCPQNILFDHTKAMLNYDEVRHDYGLDILNKILDNEILPEDLNIDYRILSRSWKAILKTLIDRNIVDRYKTCKMFDYYYEERRAVYPRHYINSSLL